MAAKVFEKSAEETAFRAVLKEVYESGKNSVAVLWADAALSARFQETLYAFLLKDVLGSAAAGVKLRALCAFCGGEAETAQTEYTHETFIGLMSPITKGENKGAVRLDLFFKKGEAHFIPTLFAYVMNNILGDCFKKAVPDSLDRELEGEDGSMALGASLAGEENTEREVVSEMMSAGMVQAVYETLHDRPDELFAFAHKQSEGQMDCKTLLKTLRRLRTPEKVYLDAMTLLGAAAQNKAEWDEKALLRLERILKMCIKSMRVWVGCIGQEADGGRGIGVRADALFHPDHVVPAAEFIAAFFERADRFVAEVSVKIGTVVV